MCGRTTLIAEARAVAGMFDLAVVPELFPRYNIAPTQPLLAVRLVDGQRAAVNLRWGLIPSWSKDVAGTGLINARSETVAEKPAFRTAFRKRRCLVPADGFYEWQPQPSGKQPFLFRRPDHGLFAVAGLWETWVNPEGRSFETCALLTTTANAGVRPVHERMPVLIDDADFERWLDPAAPAADLLALLRPAADDALTATPVQRFINNARNEGPRCVEPLPGSLFDPLAG
jgi:putative SOS response-associated peptidase YedK